MTEKLEEMSDSRAQPVLPSNGQGEAEPSAALDAFTLRALVEQGRKQQAARLAGATFTDWLLALAKIADPDDPAGWLIGSVVLNEECWFDTFSEGYSPEECWAEECWAEECSYE